MTNLPNIDPGMIANNLTPFEPTHPGDLIRDELESLNMPQSELAERIGMQLSDLNAVVNGKCPVDAELSLMLEAALGIPAEVWLRLQDDYNMQQAKANRTFMNKLSRIRRIAAVL